MILSFVPHLLGPMGVIDILFQLLSVALLLGFVFFGVWLYNKFLMNR